MNLNNARKEMFYSPENINDRFMGVVDFAGFAPTNVLKADYWIAGVDAYVNDFWIYEGDKVKALVEAPGDLNMANVIAKEWRVTRFSDQHGSRNSLYDPGFDGEMSFDNDNGYRCVTPGTAGNAIWKGWTMYAT